MEPIKIQDAGSSDRYDLSVFEIRTAKTYYDIANRLASRYPLYWPPKSIPGGGHQSADQEGEWRPELARIINAGGVVVIANHTSSGNNLIGVGVARVVSEPGVAEEVVIAALYDPERMYGEIREYMRAACKEKGLQLSREKITRSWVPV